MQHLIHIGLPKAGSTFLQRWFSDHPQLAYAEGGIASFHTIFDFIRFSARPVAPYSYFVTSTEALSAPLPYWGLGLYFPHQNPLPVSIPEARGTACGLLKDLFPSAHILIITRGFRGAMFSLYSQYVREGGKLPFEHWVHRPRPEWQYSDLIELYRQTFPGRVTVLPFELLSTDPNGFLDTLCHRLGINAHPFPTERVNEALSGTELRWYPKLATAFGSIPYVRRWHYKVFVPASFKNLLAWPIRVLDWLAPTRPVTADLIPDAVLQQFRKDAEIFRDEPIYQAFRQEYLLN